MNRKKVNFQSLKKQLQIIIDSIERQFIILNKVEFNKYVDMEEVRPKKIEAKHTLKIGVNFSEVQSDKDNDKYFAIIINYSHEEELYSAEKKEKKYIANMKIEYTLNLILSPSEEIKSVLSNKDVLMKYAEGTGLLTIYPYIRHMADVLHREARIYIPPYSPVKVKLPK